MEWPSFFYSYEAAIHAKVRIFTKLLDRYSTEVS